MTLAGFRALFPELEKASDALVTSFLGVAGLDISCFVWGPKADNGTYFHAADLLCKSPFGQAARLVAKDGSTTYGNVYEAMKRALGCGGLVT